MTCGRSSGWPRRVITRPSGVTSVRMVAPKPASMRSVWSRVGSRSITTVSPGAFSPASSTADFTCALGTGTVYCTGRGFAAPTSTSGSRPPRRPWACAPNSASGSVTRPMGRDRRLASPLKVALRSEVAIAPMINRTPVPELPQSITSSGSRKPPTPTPCTVHSPAPTCVTVAPKARIARPVSSTSCPSRRPVIRVSPTQSAPRISDRCETDLSPGICTVPRSAPAARACIGFGAP
jgi:hypothetical protein